MNLLNRSKQDFHSMLTRIKRPGLLTPQIVKAMKLTFILLTAVFLQVSAKGLSQKVTLALKDAPVEKFFREIERQTGLGFLYTKKILQDAPRVTIGVTNAPVTEVLEKYFSGHQLGYTIQNNTIVVTKKPEGNLPPGKQDPPVAYPITGRITNKEGDPLSGASIVNKRTGQGVIADANGVFKVNNVAPDDVLEISNVGYKPQMVRAGDFKYLNVILETSVDELDRLVVIGYGTTTKRLSTGSVSKMKGDDIRKQPVENPMLALGGRLPGLQITQTSGISGAPVNVQIRGKNSLGAGNEPLYVIDGVPFAHTLGNVALGNGITAQIYSGLTSASTGTSPFVSINPGDIESIEVLKDADATAIYGSRGANGVILITTRKAKAGKTTVDVNYYTGWGRPVSVPEMLNTQQYIMMRNEAFKNDNIVPNTTNATDLTIWDTTRYTDWVKLLMGETAHSTDAQVRLSGGNAQTQFSLSTGYHRETPIFYGNMHNDRINVHANLLHRSNDNKFSVTLNTTLSSDKNNLNTTNISQLITTIPNAPYPLDSAGNLVWRDKGVNFSNPLQYIKKEYIGLTENWLTNISLGYRFSKSFNLKVEGGLNTVRLDQRTTNPTTSQSPFTGTPISSADFLEQVQRNWIAEPQAEYSRQISKGKLQVLAGASFQEQLVEGTRINASGYTSDELLNTPGPASAKTVTSTYAKYRYSAVFGRIAYNYLEKYLLNISGRRDGSSRFGPGRQFGNFGAIGLGWIFSKETFMNDISWLNFGKLRASMGVTGNDRIGNYQYIERWLSTSAGVPYQGISGLYPQNVGNSDFAWERNKKWEAAIELSAFNNRIFVSADFYRNQTDNQLIGYDLPSQTGFTTVTANRDAKVQNTGWEFVVNSTNISKKDFSWKSGFNVTIPRNKLKSYPNLETSSYASVLIVGYPITIRKFTDYQGVDPETGLIKMNGINTTTDRTQIYDMGQRLYGGLSNTFTYKRWSLDIFFHFVKQNGLTSINFSAPGGRTNQLTSVLKRWQQKGDVTDVQRFATTGTPVTQYSFYANFSDARVADASYLRLRNLALNYQFGSGVLHKLKIESLRAYFQAQNLFTISPYKTGDPETLSYYDAPLRMLTIGFQATL